MRVIDQDKALKLLKRFGIPIANSVVIKAKKDLLKAAKKVKYPLALKIDSPDIIHKTDANALRLNIKDDAELEKAFDEISKAAKKKNAKIKGFLLQSMEEGHEVVIGVKKDLQFGNVVMFGIGGIFVEVLKDVAFRISPVNKNQALGMIKEIKAFPILEGIRGMPKANTDAISKILINVSKLAEKNKQIAEIDLNPIIVNEKTAKVVDARMVTDEKK